ncbi:CHAP domain-containing protein [Acidimangrovimonas sediminis]|uniref:CHAP domain-containing protein n=1 Tax=Acidimangrovimonas sediminis TaxID=2056283 RepID=UPI001E4A9BC2|nr:CHAP domain-containing protein [Acidimangrovimonas sediminis]
MIRQTFAGLSGRFSALTLLLMASTIALAPATAAEAAGKTTHSKFSGRTRKALRLARETHADDRYLWCVPFARAASGVDIHGDARTWWRKARHRYHRDHTPHVGAVMTFRPTRRIPLGHVAVVARVISSREILVNQANWHRNRVSLDMAVKDVSPHNDWSEVRVASYHHRYGSVYPVIGFITPHGALPRAHPIGLATTFSPAPARSLRPELRPALRATIPARTAEAQAHFLAPSIASRPRLRPAVLLVEAQAAPADAHAHSLAPRAAIQPRLRPVPPVAPELMAAATERPELRPAEVHG